MNRVEIVHPEYNENVLNSDWSNITTYTWDVVNPVGLASLSYVDDPKYYSNTLQVTINSGYSTNDTSIVPEDGSYEINVNKNGNYVFSFRVLIPASTWFPEVEGMITILKVSDDSTVHQLPFKIGNNTEPEFTFRYNKWQTFYQTILLQQNVDYKIVIQIDQDASYTPDAVELNFAGFKLEYISDKDYKIPTYFTPPIT